MDFSETDSLPNETTIDFADLDDKYEYQTAQQTFVDNDLKAQLDSLNFEDVDEFDMYENEYIKKELPVHACKY